MPPPHEPERDATQATLFLCGDLMTGRGVDQILPHPGNPALHEPYIRDARQYVELAEARSGPISRSTPPGYFWGDALDVLFRTAPDLRLVNLETSVTTSDDAWPDKGIHYRMHPANVACLEAARLDVCVVANNHVLDWGYAGLTETLLTLRRAGIQPAGAGSSAAEAERPAVVDLKGRGRVLVFACAAESSGVPPVWAAAKDGPGVAFLEDLSARAADALVARVRRVKRQNDLAIVSLHWGGNWGYPIPDAQIRFAHRLIDGGVDLVHGHSSHHPRAIELYAGKLILYGAGDFFNDYEGITGYEAYRGDLSLMYLPVVDLRTGRLESLRMVPMRTRRLRLGRATEDAARWLRDTLDRECRLFGCRVLLEPSLELRLQPEG